MSPAPPLQILYQDDQVIAVEKPAWAVVHPTRGARGALVVVRALAEQIGASVFPVHRLDRQTSGVLLLARSAGVASILSTEFREERVRKTYLGLCRGPVAEVLRIDHPVHEGDARRPACTEVEPLEVLCNRYTFLRARPQSGRRHQIRYHLKHAAHPLVGDTEYGRGDINRFFRERFQLSRLFLHAESLRVLHPREPRYLELSSPLPAELQAVIWALRAYAGPVA